VEHALLIIQVLIWFLCPALIGLILLQGGAGDISSAFGGGGQLDSTLGVGASSKMAKITGWLCAILFVFVVVLAIPHKGSFGTAVPKAATAPAAPAAVVAPAAAPVATPSVVAAPAPAAVAPAPVAVEAAPVAAPAPATEAVPVPAK
jgi:protein translocase SecG subunit